MLMVITFALVPSGFSKIRQVELDRGILICFKSFLSVTRDLN